MAKAPTIIIRLIHMFCVQSCKVAPAIDITVEINPTAEAESAILVLILFDKLLYHFQILIVFYPLIA